jgi:hypothetical protein
MSEDIDEALILDELIRDLADRARQNGIDFNERIKLNDRLLKALSLKARHRNGKKGKRFDFTTRQ